MLFLGKLSANLGRHETLEIDAILQEASAASKRPVMTVDTSFDNLRFADVLLPAIKADFDTKLQLFMVGKGQALKLGKEGDVDSFLVHAKGVRSVVSHRWLNLRKKSGLALL